MRDVAAHDKHELQRTQKEMETLKTSLAELGRERDRFRSRAEEMEASIADLQEQVGRGGSGWAEEKRRRYWNWVRTGREYQDRAGEPRLWPGLRSRDGGTPGKLIRQEGGLDAALRATIRVLSGSGWAVK